MVGRVSELSEQLESLRDRTEATRAAEERAFLPAETGQPRLHGVRNWETIDAELRRMLASTVTQ